MSNRKYALTCKHCEEEFTAKRRDAKYCSPYCRKDAHYKRQEEKDMAALYGEPREPRNTATLADTTSQDFPEDNPEYQGDN